MHRVILAAPYRLAVDHISGDGLDNRRINLRLSTTRLNNLNTHSRMVKKYDLPIGVAKRSKSYAAYIGIHGKTVYLGVFPTPAEASRAHMAARNKEIAEEILRMKTK